MVQRNRQLRILITGCFAPGTNGTVYGLKNGPLPIGSLFGCDQNLHFKTLNGFTQIFDICEATHPDFIDKLESIIRSNGIDLVIPQTTPEIIAIAKHWNFLRNRSALLMPQPFESVIQANDKLRLVETSKALNVPTANFLELGPNTEFSQVQDFVAEKNGVFLKNRNNSGGRGIVFLRDEFDWIEEINYKPSSSYHLRTMKDFLVEYKKNSNSFSGFFLMDLQRGVEYTVDIFRSENNFLAIPRKRISVRSGISHTVQLERNVALIEASRTISKTINLFGLYGFQFIFNSESDFSIIECNPRVQGTNIASLLAGSNLISWAGALALELEFKINEPQWNLYFQRNFEGIIIDL